MIRVKRVYEPALPADGARVLVDRLWPRGLAKAALGPHTWMKAVAPSTGLRKAFHGGELTFPEFERRYRAELKAPEAQEGLDALASLAAKGPLTLLTATRDEVRNHALVLKAALEAHLKQRQP